MKKRLSLLSLLSLLLSLLPFSGAGQTPRQLARHGVVLHRNCFTPDECDRIVALLKQRPENIDVRPNESVSRINFFDKS